MKNLNTVFPFYDEVSEQYRYRDGVFVTPFILSPATKMPSWIIRREHNSGLNTDIDVNLVPCNGEATLTIRGDDYGLAITYGSTYDFIIYNGGNMPANIPETTGGYYLDVDDQAVKKHWYSETFSVRPTMPEGAYIEFKNTRELGSIAANFIQNIWLDTAFIAPAYIKKDEGEDKDGIIVKEKQIKMKALVLRIQMTPEYLVDALMRLDMQDIVELTTGSITYQVLQVTIKDPEWSSESYGLYAKMEMQMVVDYEVKKLNFKETGYGGTDMGIIKQGTGTTSIATGGDYQLQVLFDEAMPGIDYTPAAYVISTGEMNDAQLPVITNCTANGFLISTIVACEVRWSAIYV